MQSPRAALIDAHVHFHACFRASEFINAAQANLSRAAAANGFAETFSAFLLLTETADAHWFDDLVQCARSGDRVADEWSVRFTAYRCQLRLEGPEGRALNVISGYQIVTAEKLEVLALGTRERIPDGQPMDRVIGVAKTAGAIPVVPWGFGKWLGRRGEYVRSLVETSRAGEVFLGDNSNRVAGFPEPRIFDRARSVGIQVLPGTDPLPFPGEASRAGLAGCLVECDPTSEDADAWPTVQRKMTGPAIRTFGRLESPWRFAKNQVAMQLYKRSAARRAA
jgi:hypothetical protein